MCFKSENNEHSLEIHETLRNEETEEELEAMVDVRCEFQRTSRFQKEVFLCIARAHERRDPFVATTGTHERMLLGTIWYLLVRAQRLFDVYQVVLR